MYLIRGKVLFVLSLLFAVTAPAWASSDNENLHLEYGIESFYQNYEEPGIMELDGAMTGLYLKGALNLADGYDSMPVLLFDLSGAFGQVDYTSTSTGSLDAVDNYMIETRGAFGYQFNMTEASTLTPYLGLGYRYLNNDLRGTSTTGAIGYQRESNYFYIPLGVTFETKYSSWGFSINVEGDYLIQGTQKSHLEDVVSSLDTLENTQDEGYGARASIKLTKYGESMNWSIEPFVRYWDIKQSDTASITVGGTPVGVVGYEPANETLEAGVRVGLEF